MKRAELLRLEAEVEDLQDALVAAKAKRHKCGECGRMLAASAKVEKEIAGLKADLSEKRRRFRELRERG